MSVNIKVKIKGDKLAKLQASFKKFPQLVAPHLKEAIFRSIQMIDNAAKNEFGSNNRGKSTGAMMRSITHSMESGLRGVVSVGVDYAVYVHEGTRPHEIRPRNARVLADKANNLIFGKLVRHPGTPANPFLQRGVDKSSGAIDKNFGDAVDRVLKSL